MMIITMRMKPPIPSILIIHRIFIQIVHEYVFANGTMKYPHYDVDFIYWLDDDDDRYDKKWQKPIRALEMSPGKNLEY